MTPTTTEAEREEIEDRPLSRRAQELLKATRAPPVGSQELSLVEFLREALGFAKGASESGRPALYWAMSSVDKAKLTLEHCDRLCGYGKFRSAYFWLIGYQDTQDEQASHPFENANDPQEAYRGIVELAAGWRQIPPMDLEHPRPPE